MYRGADKSLARPGRKQANVSVRMAWISFGALPCRKKKTWWQLASRCCWNRARPWHASELVSFLVGLRTYQNLVKFPIALTDNQISISSPNLKENFENEISEKSDGWEPRWFMRTDWHKEVNRRVPLTKRIATKYDNSPQQQPNVDESLDSYLGSLSFKTQTRHHLPSLRISWRRHSEPAFAGLTPGSGPRPLPPECLSSWLFTTQPASESEGYFSDDFKDYSLLGAWCPVVWQSSDPLLCIYQAIRRHVPKSPYNYLLTYVLHAGDSFLRS